MNDHVFWEIISLLNWDKSGNDNAVMEPAVQALAALASDEIFKFEDILAEKLHAIDTRKHCKACYAGELDPDNGDDYISPDDFLYQRCVVVANGEAFYRSVVEEPANMPQGLEFESLLSLSHNAYEQKTKEQFEHVSPVSYESLQNSTGWLPSSATRPGKYTGPNIPPGNRRPT